MVCIKNTTFRDPPVIHGLNCAAEIVVKERMIARANTSRREKEKQWHCKDVYSILFLLTSAPDCAERGS